MFDARPSDVDANIPVYGKFKAGLTDAEFGLALAECERRLGFSGRLIAGKLLAPCCRNVAVGPSLL